MDAAEHRLGCILSADAIGYSRLIAEGEASTVGTLIRHRAEQTLIYGLVEQHCSETARLMLYPVHCPGVFFAHAGFSAGQ
jgi:hypothetical protein